MALNKLTPSFVKTQDKELVFENYDAARKVLMTHEQGVHRVLPSVLARAKKQRAICYNELRRRGYADDDLNYIPIFEPHELDPPVTAPAEDLSVSEVTMAEKIVSPEIVVIGFEEVERA